MPGRRSKMGIKPLKMGYSQPSGPAGRSQPSGRGKKGGIKAPRNSRGSTSAKFRSGRNY